MKAEKIQRHWADTNPVESKLKPVEKNIWG